MKNITVIGLFFVHMSMTAFATAAFKFSALSDSPKGFWFWQILGNLAGFATVLALTGLTQVLASVLLYESFREKNGLMLITAVFGVLTGIFQVLGFIRWPIVVPYFVDAMNSGLSMETIAFVEGMLNRYAGMALGEHLGFLCQAIWTIGLGITMLKQDLFDSRLGWAGVGIGLLSVLMALEPLGGKLAVFGELTWPVMGAWLIWLVLMAISLLRTNPDSTVNWRLSWKITAVATTVWAILVIPSYFG